MRVARVIPRFWPWIAVLLAVSFAILVGTRVYEANQAYTAATGSLDRLRTLASSDLASLTPARFEAASADLQILRTELNRLDGLTAPPLDEAFVSGIPWLGPRYTAARNVLRIGVLAADAGSNLTAVGQDLVLAFDGQTPADSAWLDVVAPHQAQLASAAQDINSMRSIRSQIDDTLLPERIRTRLVQLDQIVSRPEVQTLESLNVSALLDALGESGPARYLIAFQNPAELRASGGFPGTMALVTLERGQLESYEFFDAHELTDAYLNHRPSALPQPWPIEQFFKQPEFLLHDALWWSDFPRSAQQLMTMYAETGRPPIKGVAAVQPEVASDLLTVTGAFTIYFDGQERRITPDDVYNEIEGERKRQILTPEDRTIHKELLALIGKNIIERLRTADRRSLVGAVQQIAAACERRDLQVYAADQAIEAELDRQGCTGRLQPEPGQPTLAVTYANVVLSKSSQDMRPRLSLSVEPPMDGRRHAQLVIDLRNGAIADEDPNYAGFQRWWVEVHLPDESTLLSDPGPMRDPDAPNGGSYLAAIFPDQTGRINIEFSMPDVPRLLIRRQPGVTPGDVVVTASGCPQAQVDTELRSDLKIDLTALCG